MLHKFSKCLQLAYFISTSLFSNNRQNANQADLEKGTPYTVHPPKGNESKCIDVVDLFTNLSRLFDYPLRCVLIDLFFVI